jgi:hypothetical protein
MKQARIKALTDDERVATEWYNHHGVILITIEDLNPTLYTL